MSGSAKLDRAGLTPGTHSIRFWLLRLVLVCVLPAWAMTTWSIVTSSLRERAAWEHSAVDTARALVQSVDHELAGSIIGLRALAASPFLASRDFENFHRQGLEALANFGGSNIVVLDPTGRQLINTSMPFGTPLPRQEMEQKVVEVFQTARPSVTDLFVGLDGQPRVAIMVPIIENGGVAYVLGMGMLPEHLGEILDGAKLPEHWISGITDNAGTIVTRTQNAKQFVGKKAAPEFRRKIAEAPEGAIDGETLDGIPVVVGFSRSKISGWTVGIGIARAELMAPLYSSLRLTILAGAALLLLALVIAWLISSRIAHSIRALNEPALSLAADNPVLVPPLPIREVNEIGGALVRASQLLEERRVAREEVEQAERNRAITTALTKVNDAGLRLWQAKTLQEGLDEALSATIDSLGAYMGTIQLLDRGGNVLRIFSHRGLNQEFLDYFHEFPASQDSAYGRALRSGETLVVGDTELDSSSPQFGSIRRAAGYRALVAAPLVDSQGTLLGMVSAYFRAPHRPSASEMQWLELYRRRASDFIQRLAGQEALRESEERLRLALQAAAMAAFDRDLRTGATIWNDEFYLKYGYRLGEIQPSRTAWLLRIHPEDRVEALAAATNAERDRKNYTIEFRIVLPDGKVRWLRAHGAFLYDGETPIRTYGLVEDITEARQQLETQRVLVGELQHRTRNLMAVVQSIAYQTLDSVDSLADFERRFNNRLEALSRVQSLLSRVDDRAIMLRALVVMEFEALGLEAAGDRITFGGPEAPLRKSVVEMLSLAIHELLTNAIKYGALAGGATGRLSVTWRIEGLPRDQRIVLEWIERGIASSAAESKQRGYGRTLIEEALPYSLSAETVFELGEDTLRCVISIPVQTSR